MESVGQLLKRARQRQGLDVASVAALTKINAKYLEAIELDEKDRLPSGFFYRSFVHQYASALGLDTQEIDAEVSRLLSAEAPLPLPGQESETAKILPPVTATQKFQASKAVTSFAGLVLVMVACSGVYAWWRTSSNDVPGAPAKAHQAVAQTTAYHQPSQPPAVGTPAQSSDSLPGEKVLLDLIAKEETWLSITSDGKKVFSGTLTPNESKSVEGKESAKLTIGNAAGLEVHLNGKVLDPLGSRGQVLTVLFTPDKFQVIPQQPKPQEQPKAGEVGGI